MSARAVVVGAGVIGLTTALELAGDGWDVEVVTAELPSQTTSSVAAAFWYPYLAGPAEAVERWGAVTASRLADLAASGDAPVRARTVHEFSRTSTQPGWRTSMPDFAAAEGDLPEGTVAGWTYTSWVADMPAYLAWLVGRCTDEGVGLSVRRLASLEDVRTPGVDLVVDCVGVEARNLVDDRGVEPVAGQVVLVRAPSVTDVWLDTDTPGGATYVVPRADAVVCGGTASVGLWDRTPDDDVTGDILTRCAQLVPEIADAEVLGVRVGLRPTRKAVRVHLHRTEAGPTLHHYGHGGAGLTLSWGAAAEAADKARVLLG